MDNKLIINGVETPLTAEEAEQISKDLLEVKNESFEKEIREFVLFGGKFDGKKYPMLYVGVCCKTRLNNESNGLGSGCLMCPYCHHKGLYPNSDTVCVVNLRNGEIASFYSLYYKYLNLEVAAVKWNMEKLNFRKPYNMSDLEYKKAREKTWNSLPFYKG